MRLTPKNELEYRYRTLQVRMAAAGVDAVIMLHKADLFYFTGTVQAGALYVPASGDPLYLVQRDFLRARMESPLKEVLPCTDLLELPRLVADFGHPFPAKVALELDVLPVNLFQRLRAWYPAATISDASPLIAPVRMVKSHYEIHILQDAAQQADKVYRRAAEILRAGASEVEVAAELERLARVEGHQGVVRLRSFNGEYNVARVLSGTDAATPSPEPLGLGGMGLTPAFGQGGSYRRIDPNDPVVVDLACCYDGYHVAQTRVLSLGEPPELMRRGYDAMLELQRILLELAEGGDWGLLHETALREAHRLGMAENFLGMPGARAPWLGHGTGIELDEPPFLASGYPAGPLEPGVVFTLEPRVVFPGAGAVGIGNTFYLSGEGVKRLTFSNEEILIV
ncbi:aminopeptidase P family protein [Geomonas sp. Red875]|uniref:Aminopeptidase P family protein n=1 Tax=Geomesophilobacter sediminis TaxID=2798584 RepID=A0A8J7LXI2_9BACT|nr:aminopeptidase P family protein [Geomesophilobacter sediminis]